MRRVFLPASWVFAGLLSIVTGSACSSGSPGSVHGAVFTFDAGADVAIDYPPDGNLAEGAPRDARMHDTSVDSAGHADATGDSPARHDASPDASMADARADVALADAVSTTDVRSIDAGSCPSGHGTLALVGGTAGLAFGASSIDGAAWNVSSFATSTVGAPPAVVPFDGGFLAVYPTATTALQGSVFGASWSTPTAIQAGADGAGPALGLGSPALAAAGSTAHLVYLGSDHKLYHGVYSGSSWGGANDPVGGSGASQGFGPNAFPTAALAGATLYAAYDGSNGGLYVDPWTTGVWGAAAGITDAGVGAIRPTLVALTGGSADLMLVYEAEATNILSSTVHTPGSGAGTWSPPIEIAATANTTSPASLAPLAGGGAVLVYLGATNGYPYFSLYSPTATPAWMTPAEVYTNSLALASAPTVAPGACGFDAVAALVETVGVEIVTLKGSTWSSPVVVGGTGSMTYATIATLP